MGKKLHQLRLPRKSGLLSKPMGQIVNYYVFIEVFKKCPVIESNYLKSEQDGEEYRVLHVNKIYHCKTEPCFITVSVQLDKPLNINHQYFII